MRFLLFWLKFKGSIENTEALKSPVNPMLAVLGVIGQKKELFIT